MDDNKKTLITVATHGDEGFSLPVVKRLSKRYQFDWRINNPRALEKNQRYVEADMNRSGPGNPTSISYEERKAFENIAYASKYKRTIDIHGSISNCGIFIILSDPNWQNIEFAKQLNIQKIVLWPSLLPTGPLTQFIPSSLEIECGPMNEKVGKDLEKILASFLKGEPRKMPCEFYIVTGCLRGICKKKMKDFEEVSYKGQKFIPLLVDQYTGIKCYMLQRLRDTLLNSE